LSIIRKIFTELKNRENESILNTQYHENAKDAFVISIVEGWRGEIVQVATIDSEGKLSRYKIKDPSFNNWFGLQMALRGNGISDFPLCNKGFDLSYCGFDL